MNIKMTKVPPRKDIEESPSFKETLKEFTNTCTIVGLSQVATRKSWVLQVMWALTAIGGCCIAIWQTWSVITEYCEHKVIMKSEWRYEGQQLLPSITICALHQVTSDKSIETAFEKHQEEKEWRPEHPKLENKSKKYFNTFQAAVDWNGGMYEIDSMLSDYRDDQESINGWNGLQLSFIKGDDEQCFSFNSAINPKHWIRSPPYTGATFYVFSNPALKTTSMRTAIVMYMSTPGIAQIIDSGDGGAISLQTGNSYIISVDWDEVTRIEDRGTLGGCVASEGQHQKESLFYSLHKPYMYSIEACTKTMMQNISLQYCGCFIENIPIGYFVHKYPNAKPCDSTCAHVLNMTDIFKECGMPCWEMSFRTTMQQTPLLLFQDDFMKDMKDLQDKLNISTGNKVHYNNMHVKFDSQLEPGVWYSEQNTSYDKQWEQGLNTSSAGNNPSSNMSEYGQVLLEYAPRPEILNFAEMPGESYFSFGKQYSDEVVQNRLVMVKVQVKSPMMSIFYETPKYSLSDFWGVVGGNLGLWLGVSAISIAELVELFLIMFGQLWKKLTNSERVIPVKSQPVIVHVMQISQN